MNSLLIATNNTGKCIEIQKMLANIPYKIVTLQDLSILEDVEETENTFEGNAKLKSEFFYNISGIPTAADDSGIIVDALKNELGVKTRRWGAGENATDEEWIQYFLERMKGEENRNARFLTVAALTINNTTHLFEGHIDGVITETVEAPYLPRLPLSGCFKPNGHDEVFSALWEKNAKIPSHRSIAFAKLKQFLLENK